MLCDQFVNLTFDEFSKMFEAQDRGEFCRNMWKGYERIIPIIRRAHKFSLDDDVCIAAESVRQGRPASMAAAMEYCRLPFGTTWIEWADPARHFGERSLAAGTHPAVRVAMLIECKEGEGCGLNMGIVHLLWSLRPPFNTLRLSECCAMFDFTHTVMRQMREVLAPKTIVSREQAVAAMFRDFPHLKRYARSPDDLTALVNGQDEGILMPSHYVWKDLADRILSDPQIGVQMVRECSGDWDGEVGFLKAILILMNCRNGVEQHASQPAPKLDRQRIRAGKLPLLEHRVVKLKLRGPEKHGEGQGHHASPRAHLVRGHFKLRKTGVYFWSPFVRGDSKLGVIHHRYEVRP